MTDNAPQEPGVVADRGVVEGIRAWQNELIMGVLRALVIVAPLAMVLGSYYDYTRGVYLSIPLYWISYGVLLVVTFWRRVPYTAKVATVVLLLYGLAVLDFLSDGRGGSGRVFLMILPFAASIFFDVRRSIVAIGLMLVTMAGMGWAFGSGTLTVAEEVSSADLLGWASNALVMLLLGAFMVAAHNYLVPRMTRALDQGRRLQAALEKERAELEVQVHTRTADLTRRNVALQAAAQVARDAARIRPGGTGHVEQLIEETAILISDAFGYYHCGIFLIEGEWAVLRAVSSTEGEAMLAAGHRLPVGTGAGQGVVGSAAASGEAHIALDVGADAVYFNNPHLPDTRSEAAVPLRVGAPAGTRPEGTRPEGTRPEGTRGVIGVLDVQSRDAAAFDKGDLAVLQTLADQIALAIANTRLVRDLEGSMAAEQRAYGELGREGWRELVRTRGLSGERYDPAGILAEAPEEARRAAAESRAVAKAAALKLPLKVRDQVIGVLDAHKPEGTGWTLREQALLQTLSDQLAVALDGARLFEQTQDRAARDRLVSQMTARMRESLDMRTVVETAANELYEQLGLEKVTIFLSAEEVEA